MPATISVGGQGAKAVFTEFDQLAGAGNIVPPAGPVTFASDSTAVATVDQNGNVLAVGPGTANISGTDSVSGISASDVLTVLADSAKSATLVLTANAGGAFSGQRLANQPVQSFAQVLGQPIDAKGNPVASRTNAAGQALDAAGNVIQPPRDAFGRPIR